MLNPRSVAGLALICCFSACLMAQDVADDSKKKKRGGADKRMVARLTSQIMGSFKKVNLTEEQAEKAKGIIGKHKAKLVQAQKAKTNHSF